MDILNDEMKDVSKKCDCAADKEETLNIGSELRDEVNKIEKIHLSIKREVAENHRLIEGLATREETDMINVRLDDMPSQTEVQ